MFIAFPNQKIFLQKPKMHGSPHLFPKCTKLVQISKLQYFNTKYAPGAISKLFGPLKAMLMSMLESNTLNIVYKERLTFFN